MRVLIGSVLLICGVLVADGWSDGKMPANLYRAGQETGIFLMGPDDPTGLEQYALDQLAGHIAEVTGRKPRIEAAAGHVDELPAGKNVVVLGRLDNNGVLRRLAASRVFRPHGGEQGFALRVLRRTDDPAGQAWLVVLCGADPLGTLYAVRDFSHYSFYKEDGQCILRPTDRSYAPVIKVRQLSESGCNLFSARNEHQGFMDNPALNIFSQDVVFDKQHFVDWLSEWKVSWVALLWCNHAAYDRAYAEFVEHAHARGIQVAAFFVPYRPWHEDPPPPIRGEVPSRDDGDCPRDPQTRQWYLNRLVELATRQPRVDAVAIESPYHDGVYCRCSVCQGTKNPYPEAKMLAEMAEVLRKHRPGAPIVRVMKQPVPNEETARRLAEQLRPLEEPPDWHMNTYIDREHRRRWHDLGPKFGTYLRTYRSALKGKDVLGEIAFLFDDFRMSAERGVWAHGFCYRFYAGRFGSYTVWDEPQRRREYPDRKGPFSLALVAEAAFDPLIDAEERAHRLERIRALTIPDYPRDRPLTGEDLRRVREHFR